MIAWVDPDALDEAFAAMESVSSSLSAKPINDRRTLSAKKQAPENQND